MVVFMDHTKDETLPVTSIQELPPQSTVKDLASVLAYPEGSQILVSFSKNVLQWHLHML